MQIKFIDRISNIIILNLLWFFSCLTLISIGPATCALEASLIKLVRGEESYVYRDFVKNIRQDYGKNVLVFLLVFVPTMALLLSYFFLPYTPLPFFLVNILRHISFISVILYVMATTFVLPLNGRYKNTIRASFHNSIILAYRHFFTAVLIRILQFVPIALFVVFQTQLFVWLSLMIFILPASIAYANAKIYNHVFSQYDKLN